MQIIERLPRTRTPLIDIPFVYDSYRDLTSKLGAVDGHAASLAIAARYFTDQSRLNADEQALGLSLAAEYHVSTRFIDLPNLPLHLHQLLIVGTTKHWDDFLTRFRKEQLALGRAWRDRGEGEDRLSYVLACLPDGRAANVNRIGTERYDLLQYYRLVRNAAAHELDKRSRLDQAFTLVEGYRGLVKEEFGLDAPNPFDDTRFDDHMLYTRAAKYVATDLCRLAPPRMLSELHKVMTDRDWFSHEPTGVYRYKGDRPKLRRALGRFLHDHYNFRIGQDPALMEAVMDWVQGLPNRKHRRRHRLGLLSEHLATPPAPGG